MFNIHIINSSLIALKFFQHSERHWIDNHQNILRVFQKILFNWKVEIVIWSSIGRENFDLICAVGILSVTIFNRLLWPYRSGHTPIKTWAFVVHKPWLYAYTMYLSTVLVPTWVIGDKIRTDKINLILFIRS